MVAIADNAQEIYIAVPGDREVQPVRRFATVTEDLIAAADWLRRCGIETVAMESTGVYWIPPFQMLESRGFKVSLVNPRHGKNVPGRKSDVCDCQWLQYLHGVGLPRASFRPERQICAVRSLMRYRESWWMAAVHLEHMQKALNRMNLRLHHGISDLSGTTGMANPGCDPCRRARPAATGAAAQSAHQGRPDHPAQVAGERLPAGHLFTLRQSVVAYRATTKGCSPPAMSRSNRLPSQFSDSALDDPGPLPPAENIGRSRGGTSCGSICAGISIASSRST